MLKEIAQDIKHIAWLLKTTIVNLLKCEYADAKEGIYLIVVHFKYKKLKVK